jgi:hypothetical protein
MVVSYHSEASRECWKAPQTCNCLLRKLVTLYYSFNLEVKDINLYGHQSNLHVDALPQLLYVQKNEKGKFKKIPRAPLIRGLIFRSRAWRNLYIRIMEIINVVFSLWRLSTRICTFIFCVNCMDFVKYRQMHLPLLYESRMVIYKNPLFSF